MKHPQQRPPHSSEPLPSADGPSKHLAWFLGPKAENRSIFEELLVRITHDYMHWRMNYFPEDDLLVPRHEQRLQQNQSEADILAEHVDALLAKLRRNFPFYSPRYIAHMLSDVTMASTLGYYAGLLYNPNNITTEAAPVTVELELEACSTLLEMCGFVPPPQPASGETFREFNRRKPDRFGWAHTTFDGTTATIESLWVARTVRYLPLTIAAACKEHKVHVHAKYLGTQLDLSDGLDPREPDHLRILRHLCLQNPLETLMLFQRFVEQVNSSIHASEHTAFHYLRDADMSIFGSGIQGAFALFKPVIFATGAAHYSIEKACNILGMGYGPHVLRRVRMDSFFRMDSSHLKELLTESLQNPHELPIAVICVCGTTEDGAVDPIHEVAAIRKGLEESGEGSIWLHVDAAWGGYIRSLFVPGYKRQIDEAFLKIARVIGADSASLNEGEWQPFIKRWIEREHFDGRSSEFIAEFDVLCQQYKAGNFAAVRKRAETLISRMSHCLSKPARVNIPSNPWEISSQKIAQISDEFLATGAQCTLRVHGIDLHVDLSWMEEGERYWTASGISGRKAKLSTEKQRTHVRDAFLAMSSADSIICDPHKMGYVLYPCGFVAFADNRSRRCLQQEAPYISSLNSQNHEFNLPARYPKPPVANHSSSASDANTPQVESLMRSMMEGSRPGAVASALWLHTNVIPPTIDGHGHIVRASMLAARELFAWLWHWEDSLTRKLADRPNFVFRLVTAGPPDTNVVVFTVQPKNNSTLERMNQLTDDIYAEFAIQAELGERIYSYDQAFFVSRTHMKETHYGQEALAGFWDRCKIMDHHSQYPENGLKVIRAAVMNPYLFIGPRHERQNLIRDFVLELDAAARRSLRARS